MSIYQVYPKKKKEIFPFWKGLSLTKKLIGINVISFVLFWILIATKVFDWSYVAIVPQNIMDLKYVWTFVTSMFMHGGFFHLFVNMLSLYFVGTLVEKIIGRKRYFWLYMVSGLLASLLFVLTASLFGDMNVPAVGASGALFGIIGVLIFLTPDLPVYMMFIPIPIKMKYAAPGMLALLWIVSISAGLPIGNIAHLGGLLAGVAYGLFLRNKFPNKMRMVQNHFR